MRSSGRPSRRCWPSGRGSSALAVGPDGGRRRAAPSATRRSTGACAVGDRVLLNTTAVDLGARHRRLALRRRARRRRGRRRSTTPSRRSHHEAALHAAAARRPRGRGGEPAPRGDGRGRRTLGGMPVVCCGLHSQLAARRGGRQGALRPDARVAYVMTDAASLPLALSDLVPRVPSRRASSTSPSRRGQAFGGELEAVTLHSGLLAARHVAGADVAIVADRPGRRRARARRSGTAASRRARRSTPPPRSAGRPVAVAAAVVRRRARAPSRREPPHPRRRSAALALAPCARRRARAPGRAGRGRRRGARRGAACGSVTSARDARRRAAGPARGRVRTMGRGPDEDPAFFAAAAAAGWRAARVDRLARPAWLRSARAVGCRMHKPSMPRLRAMRPRSGAGSQRAISRERWHIPRTGRPARLHIGT